MEENIWKFWDSSFITIKEYEKNRPKAILEYYGEKLEKDTNNLLTYEIIENITGDNNFSTVFYCMVPDRKYSIRFFEIIHYALDIYPCQFSSMLTENRYQCSNKEELKEKIEEEIKNAKTKLTLTKLLYRFYDKETFEKIMIQ
jgi:hypothetical protein